MAATSSVSSNALNFMSSMKNGVDPRTGLYTVSINLPEVQTNDLRGPGFGLALAFSPLNTLDSGYGYGWNLQLSQYTPGDQILSLSTGETFKVTGSDSATGQLTMKEKRLDSFHFYQESNDRYRVMHKSGLVEILEMHGSTQNRVALPVEIRSPIGHRVTLGYQSFDGGHQVLAWVKDESGETLLSIKRDSASVEFLQLPFGGPDGGPLARYVMTLGSTDRYVTRISLPQTAEPTDPLASWRFEYRLIDDNLYMSSVETPSGGREEMFYQDSGHEFPAGSSRKPLPRVTRHLTYPVRNEPPFEVRFTYKLDKPGQNDRNFLGYGLNIAWADDGLDNLYKHIGTYEYSTVETLWVTDKPTAAVPNPQPRAVRKIERTFNQFHLLTGQVTTQNNNVEAVETEYFLTPGVAFDRQPNYCQMPKSVKTTWSLLDNPTHRRVETASNTYDNFGNLLTRTLANGVVETNTWYPAAGDADIENCPPDPEGFVRQLKEKTIIPAPSPNGEAPTLRTRYRYRALPTLTDSNSSDWLTLKSQVLLEVAGSNETEFERMVVEHFDVPSDAFLHGLVKRQTVTLNEKSTRVEYEYNKFISRQFNLPVRQIRETLSTDFDSASRTIVRQHSLLTAQERLNRIDGVETHYHYDVLGRITSEEVAPDTNFTARREYKYVLSTDWGQKIEHVSINAKKVTTRDVLDGLGRVIFQERDNVDAAAPGRMRQTLAAVFNAWGTLEEQTDFDWHDGEKLELKSRFFYDDWAQQSCVIGPDGVETHQRIDPIGTDESQGPIHRSWLQSPGPNPAISGLNETWMNLFGKPTRTATLDATEQEIAIETFLYDGLGRTTSHSDPLKYVTQYAYDARSRLVSNTLPDATVITRSYAPHSASELPVALSVNGGGAVTLVGTQDFDGLGRLTRTTTGQRTERFAYEAGFMQVKTRTTPGKHAIEYDYNLTLTGNPISSSAPDEQSSFAYDSTSARLTQATNEHGTRKYHYNTANQLLGESWVDAQEQTWETLYSVSMQGRQHKRTEVKTTDSDGLDTLYVYDDYGRVKEIEQGQLRVGFEYNRLSQLSKVTTEDVTAKTTLVTALEYDDQGRETKRTLTMAGQTPRTLEQTWQPDGLLEIRHLQQNAVSLLKETFTYDRRGRLTRHDCEGTTLPRDSEGRAFKRQTFMFDVLDNLKTVLTYFADDRTERATFTYSTLDPCQLLSIAYMPARPTDNPVFNYNLDGCQLNDEHGQLLSYDSQNRLLNVKSASGQSVSTYRYDSHDHLVNAQHGNDSETLRFYQDEQLSTVVQNGRRTRLLSHAQQPLGQQVAGDNAQTLLLQTDANLSVIAESQQGDLRTAVYSAYGERHSDKPMFSLRAFNGEVRENNGWYLLGRGYRAYNPATKRFHSPDSLSPFGSGGVNPYTYCLGNPIALRDPTGHSSIGYSGRPRRPDEGEVPGLAGGGSSNWIAWLFVGVGVLATIAGVIATIFTAGAAAPLAGKAFLFTVAKALSIGAGTALGAASTGASAAAAAAGDEDAAPWAMYFGASALPFIVTSAAFSGAAMYARYLTGLEDLVGIARPYSTGNLGGFGKGFGNGFGQGFTLPRPTLVTPPATPLLPTTPTPPQSPPSSFSAAPASNIPSTLSNLTSGNTLRSTKMVLPTPKTTGKVFGQFRQRAASEPDLSELDAFNKNFRRASTGSIAPGAMTSETNFVKTALEKARDVIPSDSPVRD
ncbi:tRNA3(Ser)-specific nuclease WapA precursor [compost metagenome]